MTDFDVIASTTRGGTDIEEIGLSIGGERAGTGYLLSRSGGEELQPIVIALHDELEPCRLVRQLEASAATNWLLQVADDDDRFSDQDRATLSLSIPRTVRVAHVAHGRDLAGRQARRMRVDFISRLCT